MLKRRKCFDNIMDGQSMIIMNAMSTLRVVCRPLADLECEKEQMVNRTQRILAPEDFLDQTKSPSLLPASL